MTTAFDGYDLSGTALANRIAMAPMTRSRATRDGLATDLMATYYAQRAGAGLIVTEGIQPSAIGQGYTTTPGLHTGAQVESWKPVTAAVHERGGVVFAQLMHTGRVGHPSLHADGAVPVGPSAVTAAGAVFTYEGMQDFVEPRALTADEVTQTIADYADAARNAVRAGFDGVEIHGANGYLIHQFLAPNANRRTDDWGGTAAGRARFGLEVARAVVAAIGAERVGFRISPGARFNDIQDDPELLATYGPLVEGLAALDLAYLHVMEATERTLTNELRRTWPNAFVLNPNTGATPTGPAALELIEDGTADMVAFGANFISNPDLPARLERGMALTDPDRATFYGGDEHGYTDYPAVA